MTLPINIELNRKLKSKIDSIIHEGYPVKLIYLYPLGCLILALPTLLNFTRLFNYQFSFYNELTGTTATGLWSLAWFALTVTGYLALIKNSGWFSSKLLTFCFLLSIICYLITVPFGSTDVFYYIGAARDEILQGVNPYLGGFFKLNPFITTTITACGPIMYPPLWLQINELLWTLSQNFGVLGQVYFYKLFFLLCHTITALIIGKIAKTKWSIVNGQLPIIYLLNPLLLFEFATNAHFDALMLLFVALSVYFVTRKSTIFATLALTVAVLTKYTAFLFAPLLLWLFLANRSWSIKQLTKWAIGGVLSIFLTTVTFWPYWQKIGPKTFAGISLQSDWFVNSLFSTIYVPIIWLYQTLTLTTIPSVSAKYLWLLLITVGATLVVARIYKMLKTCETLSLSTFLELTTLAIIVFVTFFQRSFWPWYATWPFLTGVLLGTKNKMFRLSLIFTLSSFAFYLIYTFFGFNSTQTLDNLQVLYGLVVFLPVLLSFRTLFKHCHPRASGDPEYVKL